MVATYMLRKRLAELEKMKTPEAARRREIEKDAGNRAVQERDEKYPHLTPENFEEVWEFYQSRLRYWKNTLLEQNGYSKVHGD